MGFAPMVTALIIVNGNTRKKIISEDDTQKIVILRFAECGTKNLIFEDSSLHSE